MYGAAQRNKIVGYGFFAVLFIYVLAGSLSLAFFAVNITVIFLLSTLLKKINCHIVSGASILIYSVIIDIICFYFIPLFPINVTLGTYIIAGFGVQPALCNYGNSTRDNGASSNHYKTLYQPQTKNSFGTSNTIKTYKSNSLNKLQKSTSLI